MKKIITLLSIFFSLFFFAQIQKEKVKDIDEVILKDKSDPKALAILRKVNENFNQNNPLSLPSYAFKSYQKFSMDLDEDSIKIYQNFAKKRLDSIAKLPNRILKQKENKKKDSLEDIAAMKLFEQSKMFLWERAQQYLFSKKLGEKVYVLDNKISGIKEPIYELMTLKSNLNKLPKQVKLENRDLYRFYLTDTIKIDGRKNLVIRFRERDGSQNFQKKKFSGYIYVDEESFAIKKIESNGRNKSEENIISVWKPIDNKWFLEKENMKIKVGNISFSEKDKKKSKSFGQYLFVKSVYHDFFTNIQEDPVDFKGYTQSLENFDGSLLENYRLDTLTTREKNTYIKIDSVGKKYKLDQKIGVFTHLLKGNLRIGIIDLDLTKILKYNRYEGIRIGIGAKLNEKFNKYISPDGYFAYGFKDKTYKYGAGIDVKTTLQRTSFFRLEYTDDLLSAGRFNQNFWNFKMTIMNAGVNVRNEKFYGFDGFKLSYQYDLSNSLAAKITAKKQNQEALFDYQFLDFSHRVQDFSTMITLKYAPNSKNIMTPSGKYTYEQNFPEIYFNYEKGSQFLNGNFNYHRIDALFTNNIKTKFGNIGTRIYGGLFSGKAPIWNQFEMGGLDASKNGNIIINLTTYLGFATMKAGKYYNDKFVGYQFSYRFPWHFKSFGKNTSSFDLVYKGIIGNFKNPEYHQFEFQKLDHLYQEGGLEWNNFLSSQLNLGFFYRFGYYSTPIFKENFAIQLKLKALGF